MVSENKQQSREDGWIDMFDRGDRCCPENVCLVPVKDYLRHIERDIFAHKITKIVSKDARVVFDLMMGSRFYLGSIIVRALPAEMPDHLRFLSRI